MVYKLLVKFKLTPAQPVSGKTFKVQLTLTNIGDSVFTGGELTRFAISMPKVTTLAQNSSLPKIPSINPNKSVKLKPHTFFPLDGGISWIEVQLKASDGEKVELFQSPEFSLGKQWADSIRIKRQESVTMINLLKRIVELLEKREK